MQLYAVKMRASLEGKHISGAERIVPLQEIGRVAAELEKRALAHPKGTPDSINVKVERLAKPPAVIPQLRVVQIETATAAEGWAEARKILSAHGVSKIDEIISLFKETYSMRGAMLLDAATLERLERDKSRGIRATLMDSLHSSPCAGKNHFNEAIVLASKVLSAPGIVAEICVSDDPGYVTGYVAVDGVYHRITTFKEAGSPCGGRIFLYSGSKAGVARTIDYLEKTPVLVDTANCKAPGAKPPPRRCRVLPEKIVSFASNDYLSLAGDERVRRAAANAAMRWGAGSTGSRLITGTLPVHVELERRLAAFKHTEAALAFSTGYMANTGTISTFAGKGDAIVSDELNHASIIDGCRLSGARTFVYRHNDMADLERALDEAAKIRPGTILAVSDGVFSMDGDMVDLPRFLAICKAHSAITMIDEAHATGVAGKTGRGLCEHFAISPEDAPDLQMGTLSKALGGEGAFVAASQNAIDRLVNNARSFIFTTAPAPASVAAASEALAILESEPERVQKLKDNVAFALGEFAKQGISVSTQSAIIPVLIGDETKALALSKSLEEAGFYIPAIRYPTVAAGAARLRMSFTPAHTQTEIADAIALMAAF